MKIHENDKRKFQIQRKTRCEEKFMQDRKTAHDA